MNKKAREAWVNIYYLVVKVYDKNHVCIHNNEMNESLKK